MLGKHRTNVTTNVLRYGLFHCILIYMYNAVTVKGPKLY